MFDLSLCSNGEDCPLKKVCKRRKPDIKPEYQVYSDFYKENEVCEFIMKE